MIHDCIIIGAGLAGLTCGIRCASAGLKTLIISSGASTLHFSSGSIDLYGKDPMGRVIDDPYAGIKKMTMKNTGHPYSKIGIKTIIDSIDFMQKELATQGLIMNRAGTRNHLHITSLGTFKTSYLSQASAFNDRIPELINSGRAISIIGFAGFRDFYPEMTASMFKRLEIFKNRRVTSARIEIKGYLSEKNREFGIRSIDLARLFDTDRFLPRLADDIRKASAGSALALLPAFLGISSFAHVHKKLEDAAGVALCEMPTLPPSIPGMRLDMALKNRFISLGGELSPGDRVASGIISSDRLIEIRTANFESRGHSAKSFVLATGGYFSGGLKSEHDGINEPIFGLKVTSPGMRADWRSNNFFGNGHNFLKHGVIVNNRLNPTTQNGKTIKNIYCAGSILAGYDPVAEASGGGVAIAAGFHAANQIIAEIKKQDDQT
jgi:glycerol-3-phosphate dehydrogenase subunit B